jgi:hypothetical protein
MSMAQFEDAGVKKVIARKLKADPEVIKDSIAMEEVEMTYIKENGATEGASI